MSVCEVIGDLNVDVTGVNIDSRLVKEGNLFIAVKGTQADGYDYISKALGNGASAVLCEVMPMELSENVTYVRVQNGGNHGF